MKEDVLLLHGAIGSAAQLEPLSEALKENYQVHLLNFPGHGGTLLPEVFSIPLFAQHVQAYCNQKELQRVNIFGYSMGGYVGMYLAKHYPAMVNKVATLATKFEWTESIAAKEIKMLQPEVIEQKLPQFAATLRQRHAPHDWKEVLTKTAVMLKGLGKDNELKSEDYAQVQCATLIMLGDRDKMVGMDETLSAFKAIPGAQLSIMPSTPHPLEGVDMQLLSFLLKRFFC